MSQAGLLTSSGGGGTTRYPITPYTVGPAGLAAYQTIQSASDAANMAGGGLVYIQEPGHYTENLITYAGVDIEGAPSSTVSIIGVHTPPVTGNIQFTNITFISATDVFNTMDSNTLVNVTCVECNFQVENGYTFNTPNLNASMISIYNCSCAGSVNDGFLSGSIQGISLIMDSSSIGAGSSKTLNAIDFSATNCSIFCPVSIGNEVTYAMGCLFINNVNITQGGDNALFIGCTFGIPSDFIPDVQININSTGLPIYFLSSSINTTNATAIAGTADNVFLSGLSFIQSATIAPTITPGTGDRLNCGSGLVTTPNTSASSSLALGTAYQNTTGYDLLLHVYISVTAATTASILSGVGPTNTPSQQTVVTGFSVASASIIPVTVYLPSNYYALISTGGTITASVSGQQTTFV